MKKIILLMMMLAYGVAHAQLNKCVAANGKATYQSKQCPNDSTVKVVEEPSKVDKDSQRKAGEREVEAKAVVEIYKAIHDHRVIAGMDHKQTIESIGNPTTINHGQYGGTHDEQWVYRQPKKNVNAASSNYVYFKNNLVTSVQWAE